MGGFNIGGFARGVSRGIEDVNRIDNLMGNREDREYQKKTREEGDAYKAERKALIESSPVFKFYQDEQQKEKEPPHPASTGLGPLQQPQRAVAPVADLANPADTAVQSVMPTAQQIQPGASPPLAAAGLKAPPEPPKPPRETPGLNEHLDLGIKLTMLDIKHGKGDGAGFLGLLKTRNLMEREGVTDALQIMNTGDIEGGMRAFNAVGKHRGSEVLDYQKGTHDLGNGTVLPTYLVTVRNKEGNTSTINTAFGLYQTQKATDLLKHMIEMRKQGETERHNKATEGNMARLVDSKASAADAKANAVKPVKYPQRQSILDAQDLIKSDPELAKLGEDDRRNLAFNVATRTQKLLAENPGTDASEAMGTALEEEMTNITPGEQRSRLGMDWLAKDKPPAYTDRRRTPGMPPAAPASPAAQPKPVVPTPAQPQAAIQITGDDDFHKLPSGARFVGPNGVTYRKK